MKIFVYLIGKKGSSHIYLSLTYRLYRDTFKELNIFLQPKCPCVNNSKDYTLTASAVTQHSIKVNRRTSIPLTKKSQTTYTDNFSQKNPPLICRNTPHHLIDCFLQQLSRLILKIPPLQQVKCSKHKITNKNLYKIAFQITPPNSLTTWQFGLNSPL